MVKAIIKMRLQARAERPRRAIGFTTGFDMGALQKILSCLKRLVWMARATITGFRMSAEDSGAV